MWGERAQSDTVGTVLLVAMVVVAMSAVGVAALAHQSRQIDAARPPARFDAERTGTSLRIVHEGGDAFPLEDLDLVVRAGGAETRYDLDDPGDRLSATLDGDGDFEAGESVTVSLDVDGDVRVLLVDTSPGGYLLYDQTVAADPTAVQLAPTVERFEVTDRSSDQDATYDVTWNASDAQGDVTGVTVELRHDGAVVDSATTTLAGVASTGVHTDTLTNPSGSGEVYTLLVRVTDAAGHVTTERTVDTADSDVGLRPPVVRRFSATDVSTGSQVAYDYTYNASDPDGDLVRVALELAREPSGTVVDNATDTYGQVARTGVRTGTLTDPARGKNDGQSYRVHLLVTDLEGNDVEGTVRDVADGGGGGAGAGNPPVVERFDVADRSSKDRAVFDVTWRATDPDGNLKNATVALVKQNGKETYATREYTRGDFDTGADTGTDTATLTYADTNAGHKTKYVVEVTVYDDTGKSAVQSQDVTAGG